MSQRGSRFQGKPQNENESAKKQINRTMGFIIAGLVAMITPAVVTAQDTERTQPATLITPMHVFINSDGQRREVVTIKPTVQTVLHQENIMLGDNDRLTPAGDTAVKDGMDISITRITCLVVKDQVNIEPPTRTRYIPRTASSCQTVRQGIPGIKERTIVVWKSDGKETTRWISSERVIKNPTPTLISRGKLASRSAGEILLCEATAYDPGPGSCGKYADGYTATGMRAGRGVIAVDPRFIPLGTRVYVDGYGYAIAADTGGAIKGRIIDVCFPTRGECIRWGRKMVKVRILE
ncbi:MAG: 3D domain-containing protein [bacterium]